MTGNYIDTNVILEALNQDISEPQRRKIQEIMAQNNLASVQVLNELVNVTRTWVNKGKPGWTMPKVMEFVDNVKGCCTIVPVTEATHSLALAIMEQYTQSWWDSLHLAAAVENRCPVFWSRDMHHGLLLHGITRIQNPYSCPDQ